MEHLVVTLWNTSEKASYGTPGCYSLEYFRESFWLLLTGMNFLFFFFLARLYMELLWLMESEALLKSKQRFCH